MPSTAKKRYLFIIALAHFVTDINSGSLPAVLPFFVSIYGLDYKSVAGLIFASSCLSTFVQPLFGWLADRGSREWFMGLGLMLSGFCFASTSLTSNYWVIFFLVMTMGVGSSIFHPEAAKLVNALSGGKKGTGISIFSVGGNAGFGVGPLLAVALITAFGIRGLLFYGALAAASGISLLVFSRMVKIESAPKASAKASFEALGPAEEKTNDWPAFSRLTVFILLRSAVHVGIQGFLPLFCIYVLGTSNAVGSGALSVIALAGAFCTLLGGPLADRYGYVKMVRYGSLLLVPAIAIAFLPHNLWLVYAMLIPIALAFNITYSPFVVLGQSYLAKSVGFASGITLGISFSAGGIVAPALGWVGDTYGLTVTMTVLVALAVLDAVAAWLLPPPKRV